MSATPVLRSKILVQMAIIIALGFGIGVAQAIIKPVKLDRDAPPELPPISTGVQTRSTQQPQPADPAHSTAVPAPAVPAANPANPTSAAPFKFSTKDDLKDKKGHITVEEAKGLFDAAATFIDSRKPEPFAAGHVKDAYRLELADFRNGDPPLLGLIPRDAYVVVYCSGGHCDESEAVAQMMDGSGYKKVYVMHDGFPGWQAAGHPVATGE